MSNTTVGVDVSKETLDANCARGQRRQGKVFANSPDGWKQMLSWIKAMGSKQAHVCMEATGRHSLGVALTLHDAGHVVSVVNPAQIRDFTRTKLGRNKTDKVDAILIREYAELFKPEPWAPPSPAMRRLCELQTVRAGIISNRTEWKNRAGSGLGDTTATSVAVATIEHFTSQLTAIDQAIAETIDQDPDLRDRRDLCQSAWKRDPLSASKKDPGDVVRLRCLSARSRRRRGGEQRRDRGRHVPVFGSLPSEVR